MAKPKPLLELRTLSDNTIYHTEFSNQASIRYRFTLFKKSKVMRIKETRIVNKEDIASEAARLKGFERKKREQTDKVKRDNFLRSMTRTYQKIFDRCLVIGVDRMLTLTFQDNVLELEQANKAFEYFCRLMRKRHGDFEYIAVPERQKRGAIHYHVGLTKFYDVFRVLAAWRLAILKTIGSSGKLVGGAFISERAAKRYRVKGSVGIAAYIAKYVKKSIKDNSNVQDSAFGANSSLFVVGSKRFYTSKTQKELFEMVCYSVLIFDTTVIEHHIRNLADYVRKQYFNDVKKSNIGLTKRFEFTNWCFQQSSQCFFVF